MISRRKRVEKVVLSCEVCEKPFEVYPSRIKAAVVAGGQGPRFCSSACFETTRPGPKCQKCGGPNNRGKRYRVCQLCLDSTPVALKIQRARTRQAECPPDKKWCSTCDEFLPPGQFSIANTRSNECSSCAGRRSTTGNLSRNYDLTDEQYNDLFASQDSRCAICGGAPKKQRLHVDHNHKTGLIRGLLCMWCNHRLLGGARESVDVLKRAAAYLENPPAVAVLGERFVPKTTRKRKR